MSGLLPQNCLDYCKSRISNNRTSTVLSPADLGSDLDRAEEQVALIAKWIQQGAVSPDDEQPELDPRDPWAFRPPNRPEVPRLANRDWERNPIDAFIARDHVRDQLIPQPPAAKSVLLRRISLDLIGLPPTS